eukprot:361791-Chlamydomonas_euryale.AAC.20
MHANLHAHEHAHTYLIVAVCPALPARPVVRVAAVAARRRQSATCSGAAAEANCLTPGAADLAAIAIPRVTATAGALADAAAAAAAATAGIAPSRAPAACLARS